MARWVSCDQPDHHKSVIFPAALELMNLFIVWGEFFAFNYSPNSHVLYSLALNLYFVPATSPAKLGYKSAIITRPWIKSS